MGDTKTSPNKSWSDSASITSSHDHSSSLGSQDSGFSDVEHYQIKSEPARQLLLQNLSPSKFSKQTPSTESDKKSPNLSINHYKKTIPNKKLILRYKKNNSNNSSSSSSSSSSSTPVSSSSSKINRNLFHVRQKREAHSDQYSKDRNTTHSNNSCNNNSSKEVDVSYKELCSLYVTEEKEEEDEENEEFENYLNSTSAKSLLTTSDSDSSELNEREFESINFTSTPVLQRMSSSHGRFRREIRPVPRILPIENASLQHWLNEVQQLYDQECMITLQCKSIATELAQKVSEIAAYQTHDLRKMLGYAQEIQEKYQKITGEENNSNSLVQSFTQDILNFIETFDDQSQFLTEKRKEMKKLSAENTFNQNLLYNWWQTVYQNSLIQQIKQLIRNLEFATSEINLRGTITGITSILLRHEELIEIFIRFEVIPIFLVLCERCEGSSIRCLLLRALSTVCCNATAIRQFEKFSGLECVIDSIKEDSRPEPERSEAVSLLAQVTAPWIEENHLRNLPENTEILVKSLTKFVSRTKCCQNLILCTAALSNLSTLNPNSMKFMLNNGTIEVLLQMIVIRGPYVSIYFMEQLASLLANLSTIEIARKQLILAQAPIVLLHFLQAAICNNETIGRRLQEKAIVALSRLCKELMAAEQIVDAGGIEKLVKICRDKKQRFDSDAVLVVALSTLRRITDLCGNQVICAEDVQELIEPKLLNSFLTYSSQKQSYV